MSQVRGRNKPEVSLLVQSRPQMRLRSPCPPHTGFSRIAPLSVSGHSTHPAACSDPRTFLSRSPHIQLHVLFTSPSTFFQAIHVSLILHPPPSPRFSTGVLPRGCWAMPRDSFDCYDLAGRCVIGVWWVAARAAAIPPSEHKAAPHNSGPISQPRVSTCQGGETHP